jgi:hypothetical protein
MQEIKILEVLIAFLSFLPVIRPLIKDLRPLDGLVWFPPLSLASMICLFPAYGFRPEGIPLLIVVFILNIRNFPALVSLLKRDRQDNFRYLAIGNMGLTSFLLILTLAIALYFAPEGDTALNHAGVNTITVRDEVRNADFFLRIYGPEDSVSLSDLGTRPLLILLPPVIGSIAAVDQVCATLRSQGFTVLTYARWKADSAALAEAEEKYGSPLGEKFQFLQALLWGTSFEAANNRGRALEAEREQDILFLLTYIKQDRDLGPLSWTIDRDTLFLAGYGPGGSALALKGESTEFLDRHPEVKGLIAVESPLWSAYQVEVRYPLEPPEESVQWFKSVWTSITNGFINLFPKKIIGIKEVPHPAIPMLFITTDRIADPRHRDRVYKPIVRVLQTSPVAALATIEGAGFLDYSDYPAKYPLYSAFFSGSKGELWEDGDFIEGTASLMTAFAALVIAGVPGDSPAKPPAVLRPQKRFLENIHFETSGVWNLPDLRYILSP